MYWYSLKIWFFAVVRLRAGLPCIFPRHGHHHLCHYHVLLWKGDFVDDDEYDDVVDVGDVGDDGDDGDDADVTIIIFATNQYVYCLCCANDHIFFRMWRAALLNPSLHPSGTPSSLWQHLGESNLLNISNNPCFSFGPSSLWQNLSELHYLKYQSWTHCRALEEMSWRN